MTQGEWYTAKLQWDGSNVNLYLNGVLEYTGGQNGSPDTILNLFVGKSNSSSFPAPFEGQIANVNINNEHLYPLQGNGLDAYGNASPLTLVNAPQFIIDNSAELADADRANEVGYGVAVSGNNGGYISTGKQLSEITSARLVFTLGDALSSKGYMGAIGSTKAMLVFLQSNGVILSCIIGTNSDRYDIDVSNYNNGDLIDLELFSNGDVYMDGSLVANTGGDSTSTDSVEFLFLARNNNGTINNKPLNSIATYAEINGAQFDLTDESNYVDGASRLIVPANEPQDGTDCFGNPLTYGPAYPAKPQPVQSSCLEFNGVDQYADSNILNRPDADYSVSFLFRCAPSGDFRVMASTARVGNVRHLISVTSTSDPAGAGVLFSVYRDATLYSTVRVDDDEWHKVKVDYISSSSSADVFLDDVKIGELNPTESESDTNKWFFGASNNGSNNGATAFFSCQLSNIEIDGVNFPLAEGNGSDYYSVPDAQGVSTIATGVNAPTWGLQDVYHYNLYNGFQLYENGSLQARYPLNASVTPLAGYTKTSDNPPVPNGHNDAETLFNFTNLTETGQQPPAIASTGLTLNNYNFGDTLVNPFFVRDISSVAEDRHALFRTVLSGACLEKAQHFFSVPDGFPYTFPINLP